MTLALAFLTSIIFTQQPDPVAAALQKVTAEKLRHHVAVLSHDSLEGRAPSSRGDEKTRDYVISQYKAIGLSPGGTNGTYVQPVPVVALTVDPSMKLTFRGKENETALKYSEDFVALPGVHAPVHSLDGNEVVFVGYGIVAPEQQWDDYKDVDVRGKVVLVVNNDPAGDDPKFFGGKARTYYGRWTYKYEEAARKGAVGAIVIHTTPSAGYPYQVIQSSWSRESFDLESSDGSAITVKAWTTEEATRRVLASAGHDLDELMRKAESRQFRPMATGLTLSTTMRTSVRKLETQNIIGILPGTDPKLGREYIVYTAHHDHFGFGNPVDGDSVYNGALDNASGVSLMLTMAEGFAAMNPRPKRSLMFISIAAEEQGLLGSKYYATNPTVPLRTIAANVNTDGMNIWGKTNDIILLGSDRSTLGTDIASVAGAMGMRVEGDPAPEQGSFYRSDHFNFAKVGVPCLSLRTGTDFIGKPKNFAKQILDTYIAKHYHQPSDELTDDWVFDGGIQQAEFLIRLTLRVANAPSMPAWNNGDEFEAARVGR